MKPALLQKVLLVCALAFSVPAPALDIGEPMMVDPPAFRPAKVLVFGDSLSDSNGDSFRSPNTALSTFNLLRTLHGETVTLANGIVRRPMELDTLIGRRATIDNIRANFDLIEKEILKGSLEKRYLGRLLGQIEAATVHTLKEVVSAAIMAVGNIERGVDHATLPVLDNIRNWLQHLIDNTGNPLGKGLFTSLNRKLMFIRNLIQRDMSEIILDLGDDKLVAITSHFKKKIPLIPDPAHYALGKWTTGDMGKVWVEYLHRMMSDNSHQVTLDNRAMAGSWTLCAEDKLASLHIIDELTSGPASGAKMLFQGSMIPPCEGLIVQAYLSERRNLFKQTFHRAPTADEPVIEPDTLVIFFNSANDFLNKWPDPDDVAQEVARDVWHILSAGAQRVAVVTLPDVSDTPRFYPDHTRPKSAEAQALSNLVQRYNTSLIMRLNMLREEFDGAEGYQVVTIDGNNLFKTLQANPKWDLERPILNIAIPGMDTPAQAPQENFVEAALKNNAAFRDNWAINSRNPEKAGKIPFFADSVHPSDEGHYAIAEQACHIMQNTFNIPCSPANYTREMARAEAAGH